MLFRRAQLVPHHHLDDDSWWPNHTTIPFSDAASDAIIDHAVACMVLLRGGDLQDPGSAISALVTFIADAQARLPDLVADARDRGHTWSHIARHLGGTIPAARHRYAEYVRLRHQLEPSD
jgi:hypothetical protein